MTTPVRRFLVGSVMAGSLLASSLLVSAVGTAAPAHAATYRYWSYWAGDSGAWTFSNIGPASRIPADGSVEGWRFGEAGLQGNVPPSFAPSFDEVCAGTDAAADLKRVAVIVDPGAAGDAPEGETPPGPWALCVTASRDATGYAILRAAAEVRVDRGLVCAIGGYPAAECAVVVADPAPTPTKTPKPSPTPPRTTATPAPTASPTHAEAPRKTSTKQPRASATPFTTPSASTSAAVPASSPTPQPTPSLSMLAAPLPPSGGGSSGSGSALLTGLALLAVAGIGGGAVLRARRSRA